MSLDVLIIEDELHAARKLQRQLKAIDPGLTVVEIIQSVGEAVNWLKEDKVDLIFLDIHLGDALSFEIFDKVQVKTPIIFTTAYDQYAIKAFKLNSVDYLLKPVRKEDLADALQKFKEQRAGSTQIDFDTLTEMIRSGTDTTQEYQKRFLVYKGDKIITVSVEEASHFFAEGKYCYLVTHEGREHLIDYTLDKLESVLDPECYFRVNRQFIISLDSVREMYTYPKGRVKITLDSSKGEEVIVSVERSPAFKRWLNK